MALTVTNTGTLTASAADQTLGAERTDAKTYVCQLDLSNMVSGDIIEVRVKIKVVSAGSAIVLYIARFNGVQRDPATQTPPIPAPYSVTFSLKQTAGAGYRDFPYALISM